MKSPAAIANSQIFLKTDACFDGTGSYRYSLYREWQANAPRLAFVMLNPSTADAQRNDATIRRCLGFAHRWGYGALEVVNLFAYRTPKPDVLRTVEHPVGTDNDRYLIAAATRADCLVIGWGNWGRLQGRDRIVLTLLSQQADLYCLGINQSGQPKHPLYVKNALDLIPYRIALT
jgi:hypothetical protein